MNVWSDLDWRHVFCADLIKSTTHSHNGITFYILSLLYYEHILNIFILKSWSTNSLDMFIGFKITWKHDVPCDVRCDFLSKSITQQATHQIWLIFMTIWKKSFDILKLSSLVKWCMRVLQVKFQLHRIGGAKLAPFLRIQPNIQGKLGKNRSFVFKGSYLRVGCTYWESSGQF